MEWSLGGPTNLSNGALLCGPHHTIVHNRGLSAEVRDDRVTWLLNGIPINIGPGMPRVRPATTPEPASTPEALPVGA